MWQLRRTLPALLALSVLPAVALADEFSPPCPNGLVGTWQGAYTYTEGRGTEANTPFTLQVTQVNNQTFEGTIEEPRTTWGPNQKVLRATVQGQCSITPSGDTVISFLKTYDFSGGHAVQYSTNSFGPSMAGRWMIRSDWTGSWQATKTPTQ